MKSYIHKEDLEIVIADPLTFHEFGSLTGVDYSTVSDAEGFLVRRVNQIDGFLEKYNFLRAYKEITDDEIKLIAYANDLIPVDRSQETYKVPEANAQIDDSMSNSV